jgi:hypothetical protein
MNSVPIWIKATIAFLTLFALAVIGIYFIHFGLSGVLGDQEKFGQFGDYVGGLINPLLSFSSVLILLWSVRTQAQQLRASYEALHQSQLLHQEQIEIQRRESIRSQLKADAETYVATCERLMATPIFHITTQEPSGATLSLNDTFKNMEYFGVPNVNKLLENMAERVAGKDAISLHLNTLRTQMVFAVTSACNLIQYLDVPVLRQAWEMRLRTLITDLSSSNVITDAEDSDFKLALHGAMSMMDSLSPTQMSNEKL